MVKFVFIEFLELPCILKGKFLNGEALDKKGKHHTAAIIFTFAKKTFLHLRFYPYSLQFRHPFRIAHGTRTATDVVYVELSENGKTGFGEAALPPYLPENVETVKKFLSKIKLERFSVAHGVQKIMNYVNAVENGSRAAKAAVDIALHDLWGKTKNISLKKIFNPENLPPVYSTFTIGMGKDVKKKIAQAKDFRIIKLKLGGENDKKTVDTFLSIIKNSPSRWEGDRGWAADVNQGWKDKIFAHEFIHFMAEKGALFVEQPLPASMLEETAFLSEKSAIPVIADEAVQTVADIEKIKTVYSGINIKLMKCGGMIEAQKMIARAKELRMKIMLGCMSESSCAVTAAAHLSPLAHWADLDGPYLIKNDPFTGMKVVNGKISIPGEAGFGAKRIVF